VPEENFWTLWCKGRFTEADILTILLDATPSRLTNAHLSIEHLTPAAGVSQTLRRGTRNGITELSQTAPPIFGWAAITLGIGPHSILFTVIY